MIGYVMGANQFFKILGAKSKLPENLRFAN